MSIGDAAAWAGVICGALAIGGALAAAVRVWLRHELTEIRHNTRQLQTNGGSHIADAINRIESRLIAQDAKIDDAREQVAELAGVVEVLRDMRPRRRRFVSQ